MKLYIVNVETSKIDRDICQAEMSINMPVTSLDINNIVMALISIYGEYSDLISTRDILEIEDSDELARLRNSIRDEKDFNSMYKFSEDISKKSLNGEMQEISEEELDKIKKGYKLFKDDYGVILAELSIIYAVCVNEINILGTHEFADYFFNYFKDNKRYECYTNERDKVIDVINKSISSKEIEYENKAESIIDVCKKLGMEVIEVDLDKTVDNSEIMHAPKMSKAEKDNLVSSVNKESSDFDDINYNINEINKSARALRKFALKKNYSGFLIVTNDENVIEKKAYIE